MTNVDLNSDLGESFGNYTIGNDDKVIQVVTSVNIACGFHAGDPDVMAKTVAEAEAAGVGVGAHPGFHDLQDFGRRYLAIPPEEVQHQVTYQVAALQGFTKHHKLHHVKPHGALYNAAAKDHKLAVAICKGIQQVDPNLTLYGLAHSELISAAKEVGIPYAEEVFADRGYMPDGSLVPRSQPNAVLHDPDKIAQRMLKMIQDQAVTAIDGTRVPLTTDTVCVHGDNEAALAIVRKLSSTLKAAGYTLKPLETKG